MSGYDGDCAMYGPDGRIYQIDYAIKASESQGLGIALKLKDGVSMCVQRTQHSALQEQSSSRFFQLTDKIVALVVGMIADGRVLCGKLLEEIHNFENNYSREIPLTQLVDITSSFMQLHTHYSSARPFGCSIFLTDGEQLFNLLPSGDVTNNFACAAGNKSPNARVEIEKLMGEENAAKADRHGHMRKLRNEGGLLKDMSVDDGVRNTLKIMWNVFDENADQKWYVEACTILKDGTVTKIPLENMREMVERAKE